MRKVFCALILTLGLLAVRNSANGQVRDGHLDLSGLSEANALISLEGRWTFYPNVAQPADLDGQPYQLIETPGYWPLSDGLRRFGYGLYHLRISGCTHSETALKVGLIGTAYTVWVNDQPIAQSGQPSAEPEGFEPSHGPQVVSLVAPAQEFDLYIQVANFTHRKGGIIGPLFVGLPQSIRQLREAALIEDVLLLAIIVTLALYFLIIYGIDRTQRNFLWFGLFCLITATRLSIINAVPLKVLWPQAPYALINFLRYIGFFLAIGLIGLYQNSIFRTPFVLRFSRIVFGISVAASLLVLITPFWIDSYISLVFQLVVVAGIALVYYQFFRTHHTADTLLTVLIVGFTAIVVAFGHDMLVANGMLRSSYWQSYGFALYAIAQAVYFGFRYKTLNEQVQSLSDSLTEYGLISRKKEEFEQKLLRKLAVLEKRNDQQNTDTVKDVIRQLHQKPSMPVGHRVTLDNMEQINSDFVARLKKRFPDLTPAEQELCICLKAKLSNRDIANLRNISPDSVKKAKGRLRKKIAINTSKELADVLATI